MKGKNHNKLNSHEKNVSGYAAILASQQFSIVMNRMKKSVSDTALFQQRPLTDAQWKFVQKNLVKCAPFANVDIMEAIGESFLYGISYEEYVQAAGVDINDPENGMPLEASQWWMITAGVLSGVNVRTYTKNLTNECKHRHFTMEHLIPDCRFCNVERMDERTLYQHSGWFRTKEITVPYRVYDMDGYAVPAHKEDIPLNIRDCISKKKIKYQPNRPFYTWEQMRAFYYALCRGLPIDKISDASMPASVMMELLYGLSDGIDLFDYYQDICITVKKYLHKAELKPRSIVKLLRAIHYGLLSGVSKEDVVKIYHINDIHEYLSKEEEQYPNLDIDTLLAGKASSEMHRLERL